ncbi:hypothetical protein DKX38_024940 [Salix brachista]|uniref:Uncharacterized protein n=1 Tax=Salix brachista TaxID=2182728 RepID=A0A5N5JMN8_9ROSI|nr:hypothetical protein DKX38_024940 [Salix brachista]
MHLGLTKKPRGEQTRFCLNCIEPSYSRETASATVKLWAWVAEVLIQILEKLHGLCERFDGTCLLIWNVTSEVENLLLASHNILMGHF